MSVKEKFLRYVRVHTASSENLSSTPTTSCQFSLTKLLEEEMKELGLSNVYSDDHAYVYGEIPATPGRESSRAVGFIAHLDTIPDFPGENVNPVVIENYDGEDVSLGTSGRVISNSVFDHLGSLAGQTLITTDGTTVLGADDKAGIAEIMEMCSRVISSGMSHGRISVCFTPDEEVGHGASLLDIERMNVDFAYTVDGGTPETVNYETFNASAAHFHVSGFNIHPGSAKNKMINASLVAMEINSMLPSGDVPEKTEDYEGFYHLTDMSGTVESADLYYIVRDHDAAKFAAREDTLRLIEKQINEKYGPGTAKLEIREQYRNMAELVMQKPEIVDLAYRAIEKAGLKPACAPIRGGTDGSQLSYRGLLCPNLGTGGYSCHGPYEHITVEALEKCTEILLNIVSLA